MRRMRKIDEDGIDEEVAAVFKIQDSDGSGFIDRDELRSLLQDLDFKINTGQEQ